MGAWLLHSGWWLPSGLAKGDELRPKAAESARQKWVRFPVPAGLAEAVSRGIEMILEFRRTSRKHARDVGQTPPDGAVVGASDHPWLGSSGSAASPQEQVLEAES